ncbi:MAG: hypothetical protein C0501_00965 [Isosphaera sp.]|nr:hypothetical protein [Isosphaera sp.]
MAIEDLTAVVPVPADPIHPGTPAEWERVQRILGLALPADYYGFAAAYGDGRFCGSFFRFFNWASPAYPERVTTECRCVEAAGTGYGRSVLVHPRVPGLLPWGNDENGTSLCWLTGGDPGTWPVVLQSREGDSYRVYRLDMTTFLARVFRNELRCPCWHEPFTADELVFTPG